MAARYDDRYRGEQYRNERGREERGLTERAGDEVRSWFGDDAAERRREMDERERTGREPRYGGRFSGNEYGSERDAYVQNDPRDYDRGGRDWNRGPSARGDHDRASGPSYGGSFGDERSPQYTRPDYSQGGGYYGSGSYGRGYSAPQQPSGGRSQYGSGGWQSESNQRPSSGFESGADWGGSPSGAYDRARGYDRGGERSGNAWYDARSQRPSGPSSDDSGHEHTFTRSFYGKGPKGYQRSDDRIREDVSDRLSEAHHLDASDIEVTVKGGEVTLSGTVHSREDKRRSEDLIETVSGVREVHNQLRINRGGGYSAAPNDMPGSTLGISGPGSPSPDGAQSASSSSSSTTNKR